MAKLNAARGGQWPITSEFTFDLAKDTVVDIDGNTVDLSVAGTYVVNGVMFPPGGIVIGGSVSQELAPAGVTSVDVEVGDSADPDKYGSLTGTATFAALTPTGEVSDGSDIRVTITTAGGPATAGVYTVRVTYIIRDRVNEVQTH